ncbi:hypothetical protein C0J52_14197 [Blattella germanica]|nr:hypothetical protein C0J52_14197 [Blattella germanica]
MKWVMPNWAMKIHSGSEKSPETPVQYSKSKAASWKAVDSRSGGQIDSNSPWYQPYVVSGSLAIFMIYFCIIREENDMDEELGRSLYDRIPGLEEKQLQITYDYNEVHGHDNTAVIARLNELKDEK